MSLFSALLAVHFSFFPSNGLAQKDTLSNQLSIGLNFLTHGESCGGGLPKANNDNSSEGRSQFLLGRYRFHVDYQRPGLQAHATIQNKAVWGMKGNQSLNLNEAWVKATAKCGLFAQMGRVVLAYDDERIIGPNDFAMASLSHDILRVGYEGYGHRLHAILAYNQNSSNVYSGTYYENGAQEYKSMQTLWYHYDVPISPVGISFLFMNIGTQAGGPQAGIITPNVDPEHIEYQQLKGVYLKFHPKYFSLEGSYYKQTGKLAIWTNNASTGKKEYHGVGEIDAWMASVKATVTPSDRYGCEIGYDYLSGDDYVPVIKPGLLGGGVYHAVEKGFAPLYGSRTKFYGMMDYFYESAYAEGFTPGLQNAFFGIFGKPLKKLYCKVAYHYFAVATNLKDLDRTLGHSIELEAGYQFSKDITLRAGYTQMTGTDTMYRLKQEDSEKNARWGWFSLVVSPSLFTTKW
jgi:hypothetical protein